MPRSLLVLLFIAAFVVSAISTAPLAFIVQQAGLKQHGVDYRHTSGTIWNGTLNDVIVAGQPIGNVGLKTQPLALLTGSLAMNVQVNGPVGAARGKATVGLDQSISLSDMIADINVQGLSRLEPRLRQAPAKLSATIRTLRLSPRGACRAADGNLSTDILTALGGRYAWSGPQLAGTLSCESDDLLIRLTNQGGEDTIEATGQIAPGGFYNLEARVVSANSGVVGALRTLDFQLRDNTYVYTRTNRPDAATQETTLP